MKGTYSSWRSDNIARKPAQNVLGGPVFTGETRNCLRDLFPLRKIPAGLEGVELVPKEKPKVNIGEVIRSYRGQRGLSQGDIERRTGLLRCYLSRVENGHTVPSLETLAKIAEAMEIALADFFPGAETPRDRDTQKMLGELSEDEIRFLSEIKKYSTTLSEGDKRLVLAMIRKMATVIPPPVRKPAARRSAY
jgi:transcriptional regulator with XRE-family HTH domain